eukprot:1097240-Prymnesium_polylepis.1
MGWNAWLDVYLGQKRQKQLLAASGARLAKPKLAACYRMWHDEWVDSERAKASRGAAALLKEEREKSKVLEAEVRELREKLSLVPSGELDDARAKALALELEAEREKRVLHLQQ